MFDRCVICYHPLCLNHCCEAVLHLLFSSIRSPQRPFSCRKQIHLNSLSFCKHLQLLSVHHMIISTVCDSSCLSLRSLPVRRSSQILPRNCISETHICPHECQVPKCLFQLYQVSDRQCREMKRRGGGKSVCDAVLLKVK